MIHKDRVVSELKKLEASIVRALDDKRNELDKVRFTLAVLEDDIHGAMGLDIPVRISPGGSFMDLPDRITDVLRKFNRPLFVSDITNALFKPHMPITFRALKRRISVHCSVMLSNGDLVDSGQRRRIEIGYQLPAQGIGVAAEGGSEGRSEANQRSSPVAVISDAPKEEQ